jgi:nickel-dependent lactate racemase
LAALARPGLKVAVIVDDHTRRTPLRHMLPPVLTALRAGGVAREDTRIVIALGTHRPMTGREINERLGPEVAALYTVVNVAASRSEEMVYLGTSDDGIPAWVNRAVAEADLRVGLGMITPHLDAGWSGGAKMSLPGVCGVATVDAFHAASAFVSGNRLGDVAAPLRQSLERFVAEHVPLGFIVDAVPTLDGHLHQCVAGDPVQAHRAGVAHARQVFGAAITRRFPVVVAGCSPYDIDLWQSIKGAWCGDLLVQPGGSLVLVTAAVEGNSNYPLVAAYAGQDPDALRCSIAGGQAQDAKQAATGAMWGDLRRRVRLALVSDGLKPADAAAMRIAFYSTVDSAVTAAVARLEGAARAGCVAFVPQAGVVLPMVG